MMAACLSEICFGGTSFIHADYDSTNEVLNMGIFDKIFGGSKEPTPRVQELMAQMKSDDPAIRKAACDAIGELGDEAKPATDLLEELIQDQDGDVCNAAADAISKVVRGF